MAAEFQREHPKDTLRTRIARLYERQRYGEHALRTGIKVNWRIILNNPWARPSLRDEHAKAAESSASLKRPAWVRK